MYLVTRIPKTRAWSVRTDSGVLNARVPALVNITSDPDNLMGPIDGNEHEFNLFLFPNTTYEKLSEYVKAMCSKNPGVQYYISKVEGGFVCPAAPVTELKFSDKGVLPA